MSADILSMLVVDDDPLPRQVFSRFFGMHSYRVETAVDAFSGLEAARRMRPHVILVDISLPGMDGIGLFKELRRDPATTAAQVFFVTGLDVPEALLEAAADGLHVGTVFRKGSDSLPSLKERIERQLQGFSDFVLDASSGTVSFRGGAPLQLPERRFRFLRVLIDNPGGASYSRLVDEVWGCRGDENTVHMTVRRLREDLAPLRGCRVETIPHGYRLVIDPAS